MQKLIFFQFQGREIRINILSPYLNLNVHLSLKFAFDVHLTFRLLITFSEHLLFEIMFVTSI